MAPGPANPFTLQNRCANLETAKCQVKCGAADKAFQEITDKAFHISDIKEYWTAPDQCTNIAGWKPWFGVGAMSGCGKEKEAET